MIKGKQNYDKLPEKSFLGGVQNEWPKKKIVLLDCFS